MYDKAIVAFKKEGYQDQQATLTTKMNLWFWGNVILGGLIGSTTDAASGAMWEFSPNSYFVTLPPIKASQAEMARWNYENMVRKFILFSHEQLALDLATGDGENLTSLYSLIGVKEEQYNNALVMLRTMALSSDDPPAFAEAVLRQFVRS